MHVIQLEGVSRIYRMTFGDVVALNNVSLSIEEGDFIAIMGTSGSGKSTLLNMIGSLDVSLRKAGYTSTGLMSAGSPTINLQISGGTRLGSPSSSST